MSERVGDGNAQFEALTFRPEGQSGDVVARSAEELVAGRIQVSPEFIAKAWSPEEAARYSELQRAERQNKSEGVR